MKNRRFRGRNISQIVLDEIQRIPAGLLDDALDPRPCLGRNTNICVAEGCFNEACLDLPAREVLFPLVWEGDYA